MVSLGSNILILFAISATLAFFFIGVRDKVFTQLSVKMLGAAAMPVLAVILPFAALFGLAGFLGVAVSTTLPCFAGAAVLFFLLARVGLPTFLRGVLLTAAGVGFTAMIPADGANLAVSAALLGLLVAKVADVVLLGGERNLDDIAPPLSWLTGVLWLTTFEDQALVPERQGLLLGIIAVCFILRVMQRPFMTDDKWLLKRVVLSTSGGLAVLIVMTKLLVSTGLEYMALLVGAGMFAAYLFKNMDASGQDEKASPTSGIKLLIVIGMLTMVATRYWGMFGLVALAPTAMLAPQFSMGQYAGLFFAVRVLVQVFITTYNANVTGINITHPYTGAAQYAGFVVVAALALLLREVPDRRWLTGLILGAAALVPLASNYYLHAEPTSSLLVSVAVAGVIMALLGPAFARGEKQLPYETLLLLPAMMAAVGTTYSGLLEAGANATNEYRATLLACAIGAAVVCFLVGGFAAKRLAAKRASEATSTSA